MNLKEIKELLDLVVEKGYTEFELERSGVRLRLRRDPPRAIPHGPVISYEPVLAPLAAPVSLPPAPVPVALAPAAAPVAPPPAVEEDLYLVKSPIVGTFYESPAPNSPAFAAVGQTVQRGQVLCIVEAMKLMNEIESDVAGEIVKRLVSNSQPVEYGQALFAIRLAK